MHNIGRLGPKIVQFANGKRLAELPWLLAGVLMSSRIGRSFLVGCGSLVLVLGCAKGQMGGEIGITTDNTDEGGANCKDGPSTMLLPDEEIQSLPFKLSDLIDAIEGQHEASLAWRGNEEASFANIEVTPEAQLTTIHVAVTPLPETGRLVERSEQSSTGDGETLTDEGVHPGCADRVVVDAQVTVQSDNGALDETFSTTFWTSDGVVAHSDITAEPADFGGSFSVDVSAVGDHAQASQTQLQLSLAFGALSGTLGGLVETDNGEVATGAAITYARFPAESACESGFVLPTDAELHADVEQLLGEHTQFDFAWQGEATQRLTVQTTVGAICYNEQDVGYGPAFTARVESHVQLADDTIDGTWPLDAFIIQDEDGGLARVDVQRNSHMARSFAPQEFAQQTGILGVESEADALSFSFGWSVDGTASAVASGELTLLELTMAACDEPLPTDAEEGEGASSPGCRGTDVKELKNAQFVERAE